MSRQLAENYRQPPPYSVKMELTLGCNRSCVFCGIRGIQKGPHRDLQFQTPERADRLGRLIAEAGWNPRIEMAGRGEPTLNPKCLSIIHALKRHLPKVSFMMTTNGYGIVRGNAGKLRRGKIAQNILALFLAGVNILCLDNYRDDPHSAQIVEAWPECRYYPADLDANPYQRRSKEHFVVVMPDIRDTAKGVHSANILCNHTGAAGPLNDRMAGKPCALPFRNLQVHWDGVIGLCCNDYRCRYPIASLMTVVDLDSEEAWQHPALTSMRRFLFHGMRVVPPCLGCDAVSRRVGLLPDGQGKLLLPKPTKLDWRTAQRTAAKGPLTTPVLRPWEKGKRKALKIHVEREIWPT